jgi:hypothetical protein
MRSEAMKLASEHEIEYFETSAKENVNITEVMQHIMSKVYVNLYKKNQQEEEEERGKQSVILGGKDPSGSNNAVGGWGSDCQC